MSKGLFNLESFENMSADDILQLSINESAEFAHRNPDTNHPEDHFDKDATGAKETSIPVPGGDSETPKSKPYDAASISIPGGDSETPKAKPYDAASVPASGKVTLTTDQYDKALAALKRSFKEGYELMEMLENVSVVQKDIYEQQVDYIEHVLGDQLLEAFEDGPMFEAVDTEDKGNVKKIVRKLRNKIPADLEAAEIQFYKPNLIARTLLGAIAMPLEASAAWKQIWSTRLWQVLGICLVEEANIKDITDNFTNKYAEELEDYKILYTPSVPVIADLFRTKFGWKNNLKPYFLLVDKKVPKELTEFQNEVKKAVKESEKDKKDKKDDK